jgi:purine-binding chemotaxis protein CheW
MASGLDTITNGNQQIDLDSADSTDQYLTFLLAGEEYGVEILSVQEIRGWDSATKIPNMPSYVRGVINLRGNIVPIVDLRERFRLDTVEYTRTTVVIVLRVGESGGGGSDADIAMGLIVDAVSDVYKIGREQLKPVPEFATGLDGEVAKGIATVDEKMEIIRLLDGAELPVRAVLRCRQVPLALVSNL